MDLTEEQRAIYDKVERFIKDRRSNKAWFYFEGQAGTGKSVLMAALANAHPRAALCAFTGKAASVLSRKSGLAAETVHSVIYRFLGENEEGKPMFRPAHDDGDLDGKLVFVDEVSMLDHRIMNDFLATGCKIVACGDRGQLGPIYGEPFFTQPDASLTTIHRQAWDSAIIRQAHAIRTTGLYQADGDDFQVKRQISGDEIMAASMLLCWKNVTRHMLNRLVRQWHGLPRSGARRGEPVMCLKNNKELGILNGAIYELLEDHRAGSGVITVKNERGIVVQVENAWIEDMEDPIIAEKPNPFAHGFASTCHKSQGSSYETTILVDEYPNREGRREFLYTGATRAEKKVIVQREW